MTMVAPPADAAALRSRLFVAATPIGNLEDVSLRLLRVLRDVDVVLCEDTRVTRRLFERYDLPTHTDPVDGTFRLQTFHQHSVDSEIERLVQLLQDGRSAALVTDAGTPCVSDPGWRLVDAARTAEGVAVEVIPGPAAVTAALSVAGMNCARYVFLGFPPVKKGRQTFFEGLSRYDDLVVVLYESPYRVRKTLEQLGVLSPDRRVVVARELSKLHEEVLRGSPQEILRALPEKPKGEFVLLIDRA